MMDYRKLHWQTDYLSTEVYGDGVEEFTVGVYTLTDFPEIMVHINTEEGKIIDVYLLDED